MPKNFLRFCFQKIIFSQYIKQTIDEILDTMILLIQLNEFSDKNILKIITESNSASYQIVHLSKKRFYTKQLKKKNYLSNYEQEDSDINEKNNLVSKVVYARLCLLSRFSNSHRYDTPSLHFASLLK